MKKRLSMVLDVLSATFMLLMAGFMIFMIFFFVVHPPPPPPQIHIEELTITENGRSVTIPVFLPTNITFKLQ